MRDRRINKSVSPNQFFLFENWVDCGAIFPLQHPSSYRLELELPAEAFVALYSGNMGEKQGIEIIIEAARMVVDNAGLYFVICGDGAARGRLEALAVGLSNVRWLPLQPIDRLNELLNLADVHLLPQRARASDLVMPSKLTGMLASGRPVLATALAGTELEKVVSQVGWVVPPEDVKAFVDSLLELKSDKATLAKKGEFARDYALKHFAMDEILLRFESMMQTYTDEGTVAAFKI